jgi:hypothetical protein
VVAAVLAAGLIGGAETRPAIEYRFDEVKGKVILDSANDSRQVKDGADARGGDLVRTGWRGQATVSAASVGSRFEIFSGSRMRLASETPGVIVVLERGRLKAMFDAVTGNDERIVETPGALLAVRGTRFGVEVDADGEAAVSVFEGLVEVRPHDPSLQPLFVRPGQVGRFGPRNGPRMVKEGISEKTWGEHGGSRAMPGDPGSPEARGQGREPGGAPDGSTRGQPSSSGGTRKPH